MKRLVLVVLIGLCAGGIVAGSAVLIQVAIAAANHHFETLDATIDP